MSLEKTNKKSRFLNLKFALLGMSLAGAASSISKNAVSTIASDSNHHIVAHADEVTNQTQDQNNGVYTVKSGDTLSQIAENHNMKLDDLYKLNTKYNSQNTLIFPGDQINVADNGQVQQAQPQPQQTQQAAPVQQQQPQQQAPVQQTQTQQQAQTSYQSSVSGNDAAAKAWIASRESGGNYNARNGQYIGKYQLSASYLGGDYSPAHQEAVADQYVANRYGSWSNAQQFWMSHGWY